MAFSPQPSPLGSPLAAAPLDDELQQAALFGTMLLQRNQELEGAVTQLRDEVAALKANLTQHAQELGAATSKNKDLNDRLNLLIRSSMDDTQQKALTNEIATLKRALDDAKTALTLVAAERDELKCANEDMAFYYTHATAVITPTSQHTHSPAVDSGDDTASSQPSTAPASPEITLSKTWQEDDVQADAAAAAAKAETQQLRRALKDAQARIEELTAAVAQKDGEIERLQCVVERQFEEARERNEVLASVRAAGGPATPLTTLRRASVCSVGDSGGGGGVFVISPGEDAGSWPAMDVPVDFDPVASQLLFSNSDDSGDGVEHEQQQHHATPPLPHFASLEAFHALAADGASATSVDATRVKRGATVRTTSGETSGSRPPLAPTTGVLNITSSVRNSLAKWAIGSSSSSGSSGNGGQETGSVKMMRVLSEATLKPIASMKRIGSKLAMQRAAAATAAASGTTTSSSTSVQV